MSELRYYRSVKSLVIWKEGKEQKAIPSPEDASRYLRDIKEGKGFPSFWLSSCPEDLEKIAAKYIDEVSEQYKETVHKWGQEYLS